MTIQAIVLLILVVWFVVIPLLVVGLRLRRAATPVEPSLRQRACEGRSRSHWTARERRRTAGLS